MTIKESDLIVLPTIGHYRNKGYLLGYQVILEWPKKDGNICLLYLGSKSAPGIPRPWFMKDDPRVELFESKEDALVAAAGAESTLTRSMLVRVEPYRVSRTNRKNVERSL